MKKFIYALFILAVFLFISSSAWAVDGTCTPTLDGTDISAARILTFTCVAGDSGIFPAEPTTAAITESLRGMWLSEARVYPEYPYPTSLYDVAIVDPGGLTILTITDAPATVPTRDVPLIKTGLYGGSGVTGGVRVIITGNSVAYAKVTLKLFVWR
jgi:hypothetical protein